MYHFINQWDHVKNLNSSAPMAVHHLNLPQDYNKLELPKSQEVIGRLISLGIRASWTKEEMDLLAGKMIESINKILS
jgi:8-amino-3,8-dideoxy-alpha-D-manno-octulosonate transaminase